MVLLWPVPLAKRLLWHIQVTVQNMYFMYVLSSVNRYIQCSDFIHTHSHGRAYACVCAIESISVVSFKHYFCFVACNYIARVF